MNRRAPETFSDPMDYLHHDGEPEEIRVVLPLPPSVNSFWRSVPVRSGRAAKVLISEEARRWKTRAMLAAIAQCRTCFECDVEVEAVVYFADRKRDLDNVCKPTLDILQKRAYRNDRQVVRMEWRKAIDRTNPRVELVIRPYSPASI